MLSKSLPSREYPGVIFILGLLLFTPINCLLIKIRFFFKFLNPIYKLVQYIVSPSITRVSKNVPACVHACACVIWVTCVTLVMCIMSE